MINHSLAQLLTLVENLRSPKAGCRWDLRQTHESLTPFLIEEAYEVLEAIAAKNQDDLQEELGDVLFQIVLHCQLAQEENKFDFEAVVNGLIEKMLRRHPHVFPDGTLTSFGSPSHLSEKELTQQWQRIKAKEKHKSKIKEIGLLDDVATNLAPLQQAVKLQKQAATVGFDWPEITPVFAKIREELAELEEAIIEQDQRHVQEELGDMLFAMANLARHLNIDPELAVIGTNQKFRRRFSRIEALLKEQGKPIENSDLEELDHYWNQAKAEGL